MNRRHYLGIAVCVLVVWTLVAVQQNGAQQRSPVRLDNELDLQRTRIGDERVQRQVEVTRLERIIERLDARVKRLERLSLGASRFPAVTVIEAEAELRFAEAALQASEQAHTRGELSEAALAADRLSLVRARAQLKMATAAQQEVMTGLQLDLIDAEQQLELETQRVKALDRTLAKGFGSENGLRLRRLEAERARQLRDRAKARLESQRKISTGEE